MKNSLAHTFHAARGAHELSYELCAFAADVAEDTFYSVFKHKDHAVTLGVGMALAGGITYLSQLAVGPTATFVFAAPGIIMGSLVPLILPDVTLKHTAVGIAAGVTSAAVGSGVITIPVPDAAVVGAAAIAATSAAVVLSCGVASLVSKVTAPTPTAVPTPAAVISSASYNISERVKDKCEAIGGLLMLSFALATGGAAGYATHKHFETPTAANTNTAPALQAIPVPRAG